MVCPGIRLTFRRQLIVAVTVKVKIASGARFRLFHASFASACSHQTVGVV